MLLITLLKDKHPEKVTLLVKQTLQRLKTYYCWTGMIALSYHLLCKYEN